MKEKHYLTPLLEPRSVGIIGASEREASLGNVLMRNLLSGQFAGPIMPVNPRRPSVAGVLTYPSVAALPQTPDLAIVCTPAPLVPRIVEELGGPWSDGLALSWFPNTATVTGGSVVLAVRSGSAVTLSGASGSFTRTDRVDAGLIEVARPSVEHVYPQLTCGLTEQGCRT